MGTGWLKAVKKNTKRTKDRAQQSHTPKARAIPMPTVKKLTRKQAATSPKLKTKTKSHRGVPPLYTHQKETVKFLLTQAWTMDASDPGTGKTRSHLEAWARRRRAGGGKLLVVAPKSILQVAWGDDIDEFLPSEFTYSIANAVNRASAFENPADIYITNTDAVKWLAKHKPKFFKAFDEIVIDESTAFKHHSSQRSKAANNIIERFSYRRCLTGTPNSRTVTDLWHQYFLLDRGARLGRSFYQFRQASCEAEQVGPSREMIKWVDKKGIEETVGGIVKDITIRHIFENCTDIPKNHSYPKYFQLSKAHRKKYAELEAFSILQLEKESVVAINAAVLSGKLLQLASGAVYSDDGYAEIANERYELIMELVQERQHSLVFFNWAHQKAELVKLAKKLGVTYEVIDGKVVSDKRRTEIVRAFQAGFYQVLFLHPKSAAHGLTLTRATTTIWASPTYEPDVMRQGLGRIYRAGQTKRTENIMITARDTIEHHVYGVMNDKMKRMNNLLNILKR